MTIPVYYGILQPNHKIRILKNLVNIMMNSSYNQNPTVVIISADAEWDALRQIITGVQEEVSPYGAWFERELEGFPIIFMQGGFGKISAAASAQYAISRWNPELLINLGTCGGFKDQVDRDEIILVDKTI